MLNLTQIPVGITVEYDCGYLPDQKERLLVIQSEECYQPDIYEVFLGQGFRRSHNKIYRPYCAHCQACQPIRIPAATFHISKSQSRILKNGYKNIYSILKTSIDDEAYLVYEDYINAKHQNGSMYPPSAAQYYSLTDCNWLDVQFLHFYITNKLVGVAIVDVLPKSLSMVYTFYSPEIAKFSLGTFAILKMLSLCTEKEKDFLYLGYQIDDCKKMNYKKNFKPYQILHRNIWQTTE